MCNCKCTKNNNDNTKYFRDYYSKNKEHMRKQQRMRYHNKYKHNNNYVEKSKKHFDNWYQRQRNKRKFCWICGIDIAERTFYKYHIYSKKHHNKAAKLKFVIVYRDYIKKSWCLIRKKQKTFIKNENSLILVKEPIILDFGC